jgi:Zn-dependent metalloprotease
MKKQTNTWKLLALLLVLASNKVYSQTLPKLKDPSNQLIINKAFGIDAAGGIIYFKSNELQPGELFTTYIANTGLGTFDSMVLVQTTRDEILSDEDSPAPNLSHNIYKQYYKGVEVEDGNYIEHYCSGYVCFTSGSIVENLNLGVIPEITQGAALNIAKLYSNVSTIARDSLGFTIPSKLLIVKSLSNYILAYKFTIIADTASYNNNVYVNANTGEIIKDESNIRTDNFNHTYYGRRWDLDTYEDASMFPWVNDFYYLFANDNGKNIYTNSSYDKTYKTKAWTIGEMAKNNTSSWHSHEQNNTSAHYCVQKAWDFFKDSPFNRNGLSGWGNHLRVLGDVNIPESQYEPDNQQDYILTGYSSGYLNTYDLVAHEFTHGIIHRTNPLPRKLVAGAIGESLSDIFGFMVERYVLGYTEDWTIGEDVTVFRNMQDPNANGDPSYYQQNTLWVDPTLITNPNENNDFGYIHKNAGVMNKWFYLLSMGGSQPIYYNKNGTLVLQPTRGVIGIGIDKAARITYYAMVNFDNYQNNDYTFETIRANTIAAAKKLYGICSNEYLQTCKAWYAVNVGVNCEACTTSTAWCGQEQKAWSSVNEKTNEVLKIKLYPNPVKNNLVINIEEANNEFKEYEVIITSVDGKTIYNNTYKNVNLINIDVSAFNSGIYFVTISTDKWTKNSKFVKQ